MLNTYYVGDLLRNRYLRILIAMFVVAVLVTASTFNTVVLACSIVFMSYVGNGLTYPSEEFQLSLLA